MRQRSGREGLPARRIDVVEGDRGLTLTHRPSGDCVLRPTFVQGEGTRDWADELADFLARHPRGLPLFDGNGTCLGHARDLPAAGGGFAPGDVVVTAGVDGPPVARTVVSAFEESPPANPEYDLPGQAYRLEDGRTLRYERMRGAWVAQDASGTDRATRRPLPGEDTEALRVTPADAVLSGLRAARGMFRAGGPVYAAVDEAPAAHRRALYARMKAVEAGVGAHAALLDADRSPEAVADALDALSGARDLLAEVGTAHAATYPSRFREAARIASRREVLDAVVDGFAGRVATDTDRPGPGI